MQQPAPRRALISVKRMCMLVMALALMTLIIPRSALSAQDITPEPTADATSESVINTEAPVISTDVPTLIPTEAAPVATDAAALPTEAAPLPVVTTEATLEATAAATVEPTSALLTSFADTFTDWTGAGWDIVDWLVQTTDDGSAFLITDSATASAVIQNFQPADFQLTTRMRITENNIAEILVRSGLENDRIIFSAQGASRLYRGETLLAASASAPLPPPIDATAEPQWFTVSITAAGGTIGVSVNDVPQIAYTDPQPLPAGMIVFKANANNTGAIALDDISVVTIDPLTAVIATPAAALDVSIPTAEATADVTAQATLEATADATLEATAEATLEPTAEATSEAADLSTSIAKLPESLHSAFELYAAGDVAGATAMLTEQSVYPDAYSRIYLIVAYDGTENIAGLITDDGGEIIALNGTTINAYIKLETVLKLANKASVTSLYLPVAATSTGPIATGNGSADGNANLESFDALGATDWHNAGVQGSGIDIAIVDTGFAANAAPYANPTIGGDFACLKQATVLSGLDNQPNANHGRNVIEVVCDIAPQSSVYLYQAMDYATLGRAIYKARTRSPKPRIILITMDLGASASPGDGTGNVASDSPAAPDPYIQIQQAHDEGIVVIAAAGNSGNNTTDTLQTRYIAYTNSGTGTETITVQPLSGKGAVHIGMQSTSWTGILAGDLQTSIPAIFAGRAAASGLPTTTAGDYYTFDCTNPNTINCQFQVTVTAIMGRVVQVQVINGTLPGANPTGQIPTAGSLARPADSPYVISVGAVCADYKQNFPVYPQSARGPVYGPDGSAPSLLSLPGTTALPRSQVKPDVMSFSNVRTSAATPVFVFSTPGSCTGGFSGTSSAAAHVAGMVALMDSNAANESMTADTFVSFNPDIVLTGNPADAVENVRDYLQTHAVEMPYGTGPATAQSVDNTDESDSNKANFVGANGYDMIYGAGLTVLGSPKYDLTKSVNYTALPDHLPQTQDGDICPSLVYVGQENPGDSIMDGTILHPFVSLAYAYNRAPADACIIVMPGEYVTSLLLQRYGMADPVGSNATVVTGRSIYSYDDVMLADYAPSIFWMNTQYFNRHNSAIFTPGGQQTFFGSYYGTAQIVIDGLPLANSNRTVIGGFTFLATQMLGAISAAGNTSNAFIDEPQGIMLSGSKSVTIRNSSFGEAVIDGVTYPGYTNLPLIGVSSTMILALNQSNGLIMDGNRFVNNHVGYSFTGGTRPPVLFVDNSGINNDLGYDTERVRFSHNLVQANENLSDSTNTSWAPLINANSSAIDITDNMFVQNRAETLIRTATSSPTDALETRILGNIFLSNTIATVVGEGDSGPLINLFYVKFVSFMNNTVVKNTVTNAKYGTLLLRGTTSPAITGTGSMISDLDQTWNIHNNIIYNNLLGRGFADDTIRSKVSTSYECKNTSGVINAGAQRNWVFGNGLDNSACAGAIALAGNNNKTNLDPTPFFRGTTTSNPVLDPVANPVYYALNSLCHVIPAPTTGPCISATSLGFDGVDAGDTTLGGTVINSLDFNQDVDGGARVVDADNGGLTLDLGAFEFETLKFVADPMVISAPAGLEDTVLVVSLDTLRYLGGPIVTGGSGSLSFEIVTYPSDYGTQCTGGTFNDSNRGVQIIGKILKYCPPRNFYTDPAAGSLGNPNVSATDPVSPAVPPVGVPYWPDQLSLTFKVRDEAGQVTQGSPATLQIKIDPVNDALLSGNYNYAVTSSRATIAVQLRPYVKFTPAGATISAFNVVYAPKIGSQFAVDFPYNYVSSAPTIINESGDAPLFDQTELTSAFGQLQTTFTATGRAGLIYLSVVPNQTGYKKFQYTVADRNGGTAIYIVTIRVASTIPNNGLYDNTSFAFVYDDAVLNENDTPDNTNITMGKWERLGAANAINNTLHRTSTLNDQFSVEYKGTGFVLYMRSSGSGSSDFSIEILNNDVTKAMTPWTTLVGGIAGVTTDDLRKSDITGGGLCYTRAPIAGTVAVPQPTLLNGNITNGVDVNFTITCQDMPVLPNSYTVRVKNKKAGYYLVVDAISILNPASLLGSVLTPGYYDVDAKLVRDIFDVPATWQPITNMPATPTVRYSNLVAMQTTSLNPAPITFKVHNATGFAIETTLEPKSPSYNICINEVGLPTPKLCQKFNNTSTLLVNNIFRPFYGLDLSKDYDVTISIDAPMPAGGRFVIDSITVFGDNILPSGPLPLSNIDDLRMDWFVLGGGREDAWALSGVAAAATSLGQTLTTSSPAGTGRYVGPFLGFEMPQEADAFILKYTYATTLSTQWMICVDRTQLATAYGNCIQVNPLATALLPTYQISSTTTGALKPATVSVMTSGPVSNQPLQGSLIIRSNMFDVPWGTGSNHTVEIYSLANAPINFDVITPLDTTASLTPGGYEEITPGLHYFTSTFTESPTFSKLVTDPWTLLTLASYSGSGAMQTKQQNASVAFNMVGATGFAPRLQLSTSTDVLKVCWAASVNAVLINTARVQDVLNNTGGVNSQCRLIDTESLTPVYKVDRPFFGFDPSKNYTVVVQTIGDTFTPAPRVAPITLIWDGLTIFGAEYDLTNLQTLAANVVNEFSFKNRVADNKFLYFGSTWATREAGLAAGRSALNYDTATGMGSSVLFKVSSSSSSDALVFLRDTATTSSDLEVCATKDDYSVRTCATIESNTIAGVKVPAVFHMPGSGNYIVSVTAMSNAAISIDTVQYVPVITPELPAGRFEDTDPRLVYDQNATNLVFNGSMEGISPLTPLGWSTQGTSTLAVGATPIYAGTKSLRISGFTAGSGVRSSTFSLQANTSYAVVGRVLTTAKFGATITMEVRQGVTLLASKSLDISTVNTALAVNTWQPLRIDYTPTISTLTGVDVRLVISQPNPLLIPLTYIYVDDVSVTEGSAWDVYPGITYSGGTLTRSNSHGAQMTFSFDGTGFNLATVADTLGGKFEICYGAGSTLPASPTCMTYVNEAATASRTLTRGVTGLSKQIYTVRVRDIEEGYVDTASALTNVITRTAILRVGRIGIDFIEVYDALLPSPITISTSTTSTTISDNAVDGGGARYIQLLPSNRWNTLTGTLAVGRSGGTVAAQVDPVTSAITTLDGGTVAQFRINVAGTQDVHLVVYTGTGAGYSSTILACVDAVSGDLNYDNVLKRQISVGSTSNCTVVTLIPNLPFFGLNKNMITALGNVSGTHTITLRTLTPGYFYIDHVTVLYGNNLIPGYYENSQAVTAADLMSDTTPLTANWTAEANVAYSGGYALTTTVVTPAEVLALHLKASTGLTVFTASGGINRGITLNVYAATDLTTILYTKSVLFPTSPAVTYKVPVTLAGLPLADYIVTIALNMPTNPPLPAPQITTGKLTVDAVEVYGALQQLGSLYDDASVTPAGVPYLTYTPNTNAAWTTVSGATAVGYLNLTYHQTNLLDAGVAFGVASPNAQGLILRYGATTNTSVKVCVTDASDARTCSTDIVLLGSAGKSKVISFTNPTFATAPGVGPYSVSIVNALPAKIFTLDAVQVLEAGALAEGIYDAIFLKSATAPTILNGTWTTPTAAANSSSGTPSSYVEFTFTGIGFSLVLNETTLTASTYTLCVQAGSLPCTTPAAFNEHTATINRGAAGDYALTVTGLHLSSTDATYTVRVVNTTPPPGTSNLTVKSLHILGSRPGVMLDSTSGRIENTDPRLRYLPFGSLTDTVIKVAPTPSGFSQHQGILRGAGVYFEFQGGGFEYGRQTAATESAYNYCYGVVTTSGTPNYTCVPTAPQQANQLNTALPGMQRINVINTGATCQTVTCWVRLYSTEAKLLPVDFIRIVDDIPLTMGTYEEGNPAFHTVRDFGGSSYVFDDAALNTSVVNTFTLASGGYVRQFSGIAASGKVSALNGGLAFTFRGTGFGINFVRNAFADAVQICYRARSTNAAIAEADIPIIISSGTCVVYDNYSTTVLYNQVRAIQGLPEGNYGVFVQMLGDNYRLPNTVTPQTHSTTQLPIQMVIDNVTVFNDPWYNAITNTSWDTPTDAALQVLKPGTVYEPSYVNRVAQNQFLYNGPWSTLAVVGGFADRVALTGSSMLFRTSGASGMILYVTAAAANGPVQVCAHPINTTITPAVLEDPTVENTHCQTLQTRGTGNRYALPFRFVDGDKSEYSVSIVTLENALVQIDAIELIDTTVAMTAGTYESTSPFIKYSEFTPSDTALANGGFSGTTPCAGWAADGLPLPVPTLYTLYADAPTSCLLTTTVLNQGIISPAFTLQAGTKYTLVARVYIIASRVSAGIQMEANGSVGITPQTETRTGGWYTLRQEFLATSSAPVSLRFKRTLPTSVGTVQFAIDGLWLIPEGRGQWDQIYATAYSATSAMRSQTPGAQVTFRFNGTGFAVKMPTDANSGEVEICYGTAPNPTAPCFTYQQDSTAPTYDVSRVVAGLPLGNYYVRITEKDDGMSGATALPTPRIPLGITIDSVTIFGAESIPADITQIGQYEQNAKNNSGTPYLVKVPTLNWRDFAAATWTGGTASQVTTTAGVASITNAGATVVMRLSNSLTNPTVILYNRVPTNQSSTLLICAASDPAPNQLKPNIVGGVVWTGTVFQLNSASTDKCVIHNLKSGNQVILSATSTAGSPELKLTALGDLGYKIITFTTLTPGGFNVDAFEVIDGVLLPAGLHDQIKPDAQLNFNNSGNNPASALSTDPKCNPRYGWCTLKLASYYGGSTATTRQPGANLKFSFQGSGFSILSSLSVYGSDMRICLAPSNVANPFPPDNRVYYGNPTGLFETWCDVVTTKLNAVEWDAKNPDRIFPAVSPSGYYQYGFAYYGLVAGSYQVEVKLIDVSMGLNDSLTIDAVAVFGGDPTLLEADGRTSNLFDDRQSQIVYEPAVNWTALAATTQPPFFKTEMKANNAGSIVRLRVEGNAITIYQTMATDRVVGFAVVPSNTRDVRVCLMVGDGPIPCEPEAVEIGERTTTSYRQSNFNGAGIPILIYGLGVGEHNLIIENRDTRAMSIDAFRVHP